MKQLHNQTNSLVGAAMVRYSASAEDFKMVVWFLAFQETKESPRKIQKPITDLQESKHDPQSAFEKALR